MAAMACWDGRLGPLCRGGVVSEVVVMESNAVVKVATGPGGLRD